MMKIQKTGWTSKTQMVLATALSILIAIITVQCNAKIDHLSPDSDSLAEYAPAIRPDSHLSTDKAGHDEFELIVVNDQLFYRGNLVKIPDLENLALEANLGPRSTILLSVDQDQKMKFVTDLHYELRRIDKRKILYGGRNESGDFSGLPMLLPPHPTEPGPNATPLPNLEEIEARGEIVIRRLDFPNEQGAVIQQQVYDFILPHIQSGQAYAVSAKVIDDMTFQKFFENVSYINHAFNVYYQEVADKRYGGSVVFANLDLKNPEDKAKYDAIREGAPRAISIAERD